MPIRPVRSPQYEEQLGREVAMRDARRANFMAQATPELAARVGSIASNYPGMHTGLTAAAGMAGLSPEDPQTIALAQRAYQLQYEATGGFQVGELVDPKTLAQAKRDTNLNADKPWEVQDVDRRLAETDPESKPEHSPGRFEPVLAPLRGATRTAFMLQESLQQAVSASLMQIGTLGRVNPRDKGSGNYDTMVEVAYKQWRSGKGIDLGSGWLPGGSVRHESNLSSKEHFTDPETGVWLTPGRALAPGVARTFLPWAAVEPGSREYNITSSILDLGNSIFLDPTSAVLGPTSKARQAARTFQAPNGMQALKEALVTGINGRKSTVAENIETWGNSEAGKKVFEYLAGRNSVTELMEHIKGLDRQTALAIADETDPDAVKKLLMPAMGTQVRLKPSANRMATRDYLSQIGRVMPDGFTRLGASLPRGIIGLDDPQASWQNLQNTLRTAGMSKERIEQVNRGFAKVNNYDELLEWSRDSFVKAIDDQIVESLYGKELTKPNLKKRRDILTNLFNPNNEERAYWIKAASGETADTVLALYNPFTKEALPTPHSVAELLGRGVPVPDARALRAMTTRGPTAAALRTVMDLPASEFSRDALELLFVDVFKAAQLLRGAYTIRVMSEELVRVAATSTSRFVNNPAAFLGWFMARYNEGSPLLQKMAANGSGVISRAALKADEKLSKGAQKYGIGGTTVLDEFFTDVPEFQAALDRETNWRYPGVVGLNEWTRHKKGTQHYISSVADELSKLSSSPIERLIPDAAVYDNGRGLIGIDAIKQDFWDGPLKVYREMLGDTRHREHVLSTREQSDKYIDEVVERVNDLTGGDPDLLLAIKDGKLDGQRIRNGTFDAKKVNAFLETKLDSLPDWVGGQKMGPPQRPGDGVRKGIDWMFKWLATKPTNALARSPVFRQAYWARMTEMASFLDAKSAKKLIDSAQKNNLSPSQIRLIKQQAQGKGTGTLEGIDAVAKQYGVTEVKELLYDLSKRNNFFDMTRLLIPFGDAWKEVLTTWSKIGFENPKVVRRGQQAIEGARDTDHNEGRGFFYRDDFGQEIFAYPMAGALASRFLGTGPNTELAMTGSVQGLNMIGGSVLPGFGPILQVPLKPFMRNLPGDHFARELFFPYGAPGGDEQQDPGADFFDALLPAWARKLIAAFSRQQPTWMSANAEMLQLEAASGRWDMSDETQIQAMQKVAAEKATTRLLLQALAQTTLPTGPQVEMKSKLETGDWIHFRAIGDQVREWQEEYGESEAIALTEHVFGLNNLEMTFFNKTRSNREMPVTIEGNRFIRENPELYEQYKDVVGYFTTDPEPGTFDYLSFTDQIIRGDRVRMTPDQIAHASNNALGYQAYQKQQQNALAMFGSLQSDEARMFLRMVRMDLEDKYPGFGRADYSPRRPPPQQLIGDMERAIQDPKLRNTEVGPYIAEYLEARKQVQALAVSLGLQPDSFARSTRSELIYARDQLRNLGEELSEKEPAFRAAWERLFMRELLDEELEPGLDYMEALDNPMGSLGSGSMSLAGAGLG